MTNSGTSHLDITAAAGAAWPELWIFDLDNTLYPPSAGLFAQIEQRMRDWVGDRLGLCGQQADALRARYWRDHGTTLAGLMRHHQIDPTDFLDYVHDIDLSALRPDPLLVAAIEALPGRKIIHTNGDSRYGARVLAACGLDGFAAIYGIEETLYHPKPDPAAYGCVLRAEPVDPARCIMFEDDPRNLREPARLGMRTVLVTPQGAAAEPAAHVHYMTQNLAGFLAALPF